MINSGFDITEQDHINYEIAQSKNESPTLAVIGKFENDIVQQIGDIRDIMGLERGEPVRTDVTGNLDDVTGTSEIEQFDVRHLSVAQENTVIEKWNALTDQQKFNASPLHKKVRLLRKFQQKSITYAADILRTKLGLIKEENGMYVIDTDKKSSVERFLHRELRKRELPINMLDSVQWFHDGVETMVNTKQVKAILMSIARKDVLSRKKFGTNATMIPNTMNGTKTREESYTDPETGIVWKASDLKFYRTSSDWKV